MPISRVEPWRRMQQAASALVDGFGGPSVTPPLHQKIILGSATVAIYTQDESCTCQALWHFFNIANSLR